MGYADVQKLHEIKSLAPGLSSGPREEVLRIILAIAIDHELAAWCMGQPSDAPIGSMTNSFNTSGSGRFQTRINARLARFTRTSLYSQCVPGSFISRLVPLRSLCR